MLNSCYIIFLYDKNIPMFEFGLETVSRISSSHRIRYSTTSSKPSCTIWWSSFDAFIATPGPPWPSNKAMYKYLIGFIEHLFCEFRYNFLILLLMREVGGISISPIAHCAWSSLYLEPYQENTVIEYCHYVWSIELHMSCFCTEHAVTELCIYTISSNIQNKSYLDFPALIASA